MRLMHDNGVGVRLIPPGHLHSYPWQSRWYNFRRTDHDNDEPYTVAESKIGFARLPDSREIFARVLQEAARYAMPQQETLAWLRRKAAELSQ